MARLAAGTWTVMPVVVLHGRREGPTVWMSGAIHGDEVNGVDIVRRALKELDPKQLAGTILGVPIVNVFGVTSRSRYLPDRRDLNRSFPGSPRGSLAARLANLFFENVAARCTVGLDFHSGSGGRDNLPQLRCDLDDAPTRDLAETFGAPLLLHSNLRDGSLRAVARKRGIQALLYEVGEAHRLDEPGILLGVDGAMRVFSHLGMVEPTRLPAEQPWTARSSKWTRAGRTGLFHIEAGLGQRVRAGERVGGIADPFGKETSPVPARNGGVVIGLHREAIVNRGDAVVHIAEVEP